MKRKTLKSIKVRTYYPIPEKKVLERDATVVNKQLAKVLRESKQKELDLVNSAGACSISDRHYPKSFFIKPKGEPNDGEE